MFYKSVEDAGFEPMLNMKHVRDILGVSYGVLYGLIAEGKLKAYKVTGEPVRREEIDRTVYGLRFNPMDVREFLDNQEIK